MSGTANTAYFLVFDATTNIVTNYGATTPSMLPSIVAAANAVQITAQTYNILLTGGTFLWLGGRLQVITSQSVPLSDSQAAATAIVDAQAETCRLLFITAGFGMQLTYIEKQREAAAFMAAYPSHAAFAAASPAPASWQYPLIFNEIGITGATAWDVAQVFMQNYQNWLIIGAAIERLRLTAHATIAAATSVSAINAATQVPWLTAAGGAALVEAAYAAANPTVVVSAAALTIRGGIATATG
jgi:hypothetical protein